MLDTSVSIKYLSRKGRLLSGGMFMAIQEFYQKNG